MEKDSEEKIEDNYKFKKTRRIKSENWKMHRIQKNIGMEQRRINKKNVEIIKRAFISHKNNTLKVG